MGATLNTIQIEEDLDKLVSEIAAGTCPLHDFPFRLMEAYEASRNEVNKLRMKYPGNLVSTDITWPKKLLYRAAAPGKVQNTVDDLRSSLIGKKGRAAKSAPRFVMSTDGEEFLAVDLKTGETPAFDRLADLPVNYDFLQPMFGVERYKPAPETQADVRAARHMAKFHDAIRDANPDWGPDHIHDLNIFMTRLLFCMFAQNTGIFPESLFTETLRREATAIDGSDTKRVVEDIFLALDLPEKETRTAAGVRSRRIAADFPYVNGGLFRDRTDVPNFSRKARRLLLEAADLHWDQIHADIFGSMIQAIVQTDMRADFGMHYTSVPNIMKVLDPLFLNSLREQLTAAGDNAKALEKLIDRISRIRVFDPACGSGNFLIIAYRELRLIETEAFRRLRDVKRKGQLALADFQTGIKISSFFGIDPVDFACETAKLSLWISQYQMNRKLDEICTTPAPALPLTDAGSIVVGNALAHDWMNICPPQKGLITYIVGNPPYLGSTYQTSEQKADMKRVFARSTSKYKNLDYVACWFKMASEYIAKCDGAAAFVTTNSICQGDQVALLWPTILDRGSEIFFAYEPFKWRNNAARNAGVTCSIIGLATVSKQPKIIYGSEHSRAASNISPYLIDMPTVIPQKTQRSISGLGRMEWGNKPTDGGNLIFDAQTKDRLIKLDEKVRRFIRPAYGSQEFIQGTEKWCLWIEDSELEKARSIPAISERIDACRDFRLASPASATNARAAIAHKFNQIQSYDRPSLIIPSVSSERRPYLPIGFLHKDAIVTNLAYAIYDPETWLFSLISSRLHIVWAKAVGGQLETRIRYTNTLVYNTFPVPSLSTGQKEALEEHSLTILRTREPYIADGKTIAWLYNPETMPADLLQAHHDLDNYLETIYIGRPFKDDTERLEHLFKLYARMAKANAKAA